MVQTDAASLPELAAVRREVLGNSGSLLVLRRALAELELLTGAVVEVAEGTPVIRTGEALPAQTTFLALALVGGDGVELFRRAKGLVEMVRRHCYLVELSLSGDSTAA